MRRRDLIKGVAGTAAAWPFAVRAQQPAKPVIGFLNTASPDTYAPFVAAFREGLKESGFIEGQNVAIEYRWGEGQYDRMPTLAADLVSRRVSVIAATSTPAALAARAATATIPIVFELSGDPIKLGLVSSLNRPGRNVTGITQLNSLLVAKRLGLLRDLLPTITTIGFLINPNDSRADIQSTEIQEGARGLGLQVLILKARTELDIDAVFETLVQQHAGALIVGSDVFLNSRREQLVSLAARHAIPAVYQLRHFAEAGGLMSYGASQTDAYHQTGIYVGQILKGAKPEELPVLQSAKFDFVINIKAAKALGLTIPSGLLAIADEVIE